MKSSLRPHHVFVALMLTLNACVITTKIEPLPVGTLELLPTVTPTPFVSPLAPCEIKGDVTESGEYRYYLPGDEGYDAVTIEEDIGDSWFCTVENAMMAGFSRR